MNGIRSPSGSMCVVWRWRILWFACGVSDSVSVVCGTHLCGITHTSVWDVQVLYKVVVLEVLGEFDV